MNQQQIKKRDTAFGLSVVSLVIPAIIFRVLPTYIDSEFVSSLAIMTADHIETILSISMFFWYKAFFHWCIGKGYHGAHCLVGTLGLIGALIVAMKKDLIKDIGTEDDPIRKCPHCNGDYRLGDYNPDAENIFCSICKTELIRE